jgi:uncharacterized protein DUF6572
MSVSETDKIDIVATRPDSPIVKLVIADHLTWDDLDGHSRLLQDKINAYLDFVESGQLYRLKEPKIPATPEIRIALVLQHTPTEEARKFLARVEEFLASTKIGFELDLHHAK